MTPDKYNQDQLRLGRITPSVLTKMTKIVQDAMGLIVDGKCGPGTLEALMPTNKSKRQVLLEVCRAELGNGEIGTNNVGPDLDRYRDGGSKGAWCAAFASYVYEAAGYSIARSHGARRLGNNILAAGGSKIFAPEVGCAVVWGRGTSSWMGHIAPVVTRVEGSKFWVIEGNVGSFPAKVAEREVSSRPRLVGFYRLPL